MTYVPSCSDSTRLCTWNNSHDILRGKIVRMDAYTTYVKNRLDTGMIEEVNHLVACSQSEGAWLIRIVVFYTEEQWGRIRSLWNLP